MERVEETKFGIARAWRNPSLRNLAVILAALLIVFLVFASLYSYYSAEKLKRDWLDKEAAMLGSLSSEHPEWAKEWLDLLTVSEQPSPAKVAEGRRMMDRYGLTAALETHWLPEIGDYRSRTFWFLSCSAAVFIVFAAALLFRENRRQLVKIRNLAVALEDTVKHNRPMSYRLYDEGELGLLANGTQELSLRLRETIEQLHRDKTFLKDTVADISHQLKTPLASLMIYIDLLQEGKLDNDHAAEFLVTCRRELDRMEWLTLTLLKLARLESDTLEMSLSDARLADTVRQAVDTIRRLAEDKQVLIRMEEADDALVIPHDPHWLAEAIANLVKNAVEHSPTGSTVAVGWEKTPVFVRLQVKDQGRGIDAQHLPHIFKKFYRSSPEGSGVGLGLPLAKSIVEKHGGMLSALTNPAGGTIFSLTLPVHPLPDNSTKLTKL